MKTGKRRGRWSIQAAQKTYQVDAWGAGYFVINKKGHIAARPLQEEGGEVDLLDVVQEAESRGLRTPLLIRFQDIVRHRVAAIHRAFQNAIADCEYQGSYRGVFPLKVNQLREVVEEILDAGKPYKLGLEVGSKAELFAALAQLDKIGSLVVCNGYKDATFIRMALTGLKLGKEVILVIEKLEELERILELSESFGVRPFVGVRLKLLSKGAGRWAASGGEDAKFGPRFPTSSSSSAPSRRRLASTPSCARWAFRCVTWTWAAAWAWTTWATVRSWKAQSTTRSRNTPMT